MAQIVTQNPGSSEVQSALIAGITEGLNKISSTLNLKTSTLSDVQLTPVSIDNQEKNKNRIYEAPAGNKLWLSEPAPVIKKNGSVITQSGSNFTIDLIGGSVTFSQDDRPSDSDVITVTATYIIAESTQIEQISNTLSVVQTQSNKYKGNYDNPEALQLAVPSGQNGDFAIVFNPLAVYAWKNDGWYDTRSVEDLSNYYQKEETNNLLDQKEPKISQKGSSSSDDDYYWGGRKTWQDFKEKVKSTSLTGISTESDSPVTESDTILEALGKLPAQTSKSTQRTYLTGTGAPSTSTIGAVGQRYVNTSNGDEYICEEVSGDIYTWKLKIKSINDKIPSVGGNIDINEVIECSHSKSGNIHSLSGYQNAKYISWEMSNTYEYGDTWTLNGEAVTVQYCDGNPILPHSLITGDMLVGKISGSIITLTIPTPKPNATLLDNAYFLDPINQRGETSWNAPGYHLDRWFEEQAVSGSIGADGYHVGASQTSIQKHTLDELNQILGKTVTVSCLLADGRFGTATGVVPSELTTSFNITCYPGGGVVYQISLFPSTQSYQFGRIFNNADTEVVVVACKTELGSRQTLARQDAEGNWVLLDPPPNKATELLKCQRYYWVASVTDGGSSNNPQIATGITGAGGYAYFGVHLPTNMRAKPTILYSDSGFDVYNGTHNPPTGIFYYGSTDQKKDITLQIKISASTTAGGAAVLQFWKTVGKAYFALDAEIY